MLSTPLRSLTISEKYTTCSQSHVDALNLREAGKERAFQVCLVLSVGHIVYSFPLSMRATRLIIVFHR